MMEHNTRAAILTNARNAGMQWARDRAAVEQLRTGDVPLSVYQDLVSWPCTTFDVFLAFREGVRNGMAMRTLPDMQLPGQPPQPFKAGW